MLSKLAYVVTAMAVVVALIYLTDDSSTETGDSGAEVTEAAVDTAVAGAQERRSAQSTGAGERSAAADPDAGGRTPHGASAAEGLESHVVRQWRGALEPTFTAVAAAYNEDGEDVFSLSTFDGAQVDIQIERLDSASHGRGEVLRGTVVNEEGSLVSLSRVGSSHSGSIVIPSQGLVYEVRPASGGDVIFSEVDTAEMGDCQHCQEPPRPSIVSRPPNS